MDPSFFKAGFEALPFELCRLIIKEGLLRSDLLALTLVSKHCYAAFNYSLYDEVTSAALFTLGLTEKARLPLTGPHPASYVKSMDFDLMYNEEYTYILEGGPFQRNDIKSKKSKQKKQQQKKKSSDPNMLQKLFTAAVSNIMFYAPHASVKTLNYHSKALSLPQAFGNVNPAVFSLADLSLGFPVLNTNLRKTMSIVESLLSPSLTSLSLNFSEHDSPDPFVLAKILLKTRTNCPNLEQLHFDSPRSWISSKAKSPARPIQAVLNDPSFMLPRLKFLLLTDYEESLVILEECAPFLTRHPHITEFEFCQFSVASPAVGASRCTESILPNLVHLDGSVNDCVALCAAGARPLETIKLTIDEKFASAVENEPLVIALGNTKTLKRLFIHDLRFVHGGKSVGVDRQLLRRITLACPGLTHFQCTVEVQEEEEEAETDLEIVYNIIASNLLRLNHFKISICVRGTEESENVDIEDLAHPIYKANSKALCAVMPNHPVLETVQIGLLGRSPGLRPEAQKPPFVAMLYLVRSDTQRTFVKARYRDRPEFQMSEFSECGVD
ncbi:hypothetical protein BDP27DRAFT_1323500 [Rhodocollybia butyracea]|uniref:Uncharacterized protein n=1 Tax=Rhodocollybia butyracea TaxID=206335 RepID=A0A9P5PWB1_9AGAR|nr:hypothetical protein BDP27DRAFT_1323500 [Rhodocollybia butyracea]